MAILTQHSTNSSVFMGWYGTCETSCEDYALSNTPIKYVYLVGGNNASYISYDKDLPSFLNFLDSLQCGRSYILVLGPGTGSIDIPHLTVSDELTDTTGRIVNSCVPSPSVTPTVTPTVTMTPTITTTPSVTITPTPTPANVTPSTTPTPTPTPTPSTIPPAFCEGYAHSVDGGSEQTVGNVRSTNFKPDTQLCHHGGTGGPPSSAILRIQPSGTIVGSLTINGVLINSTIKYRHMDDESYTGTVTPGVIVTELHKS